MIMNVSGITQPIAALQSAAGTDSLSSGSFLSTVREQYLQAAQTAGTVSREEASGAVNANKVTMEEYKQYIHDRISQTPMHPSQSYGSHSIMISEGGFEAMRKDPEYEKWVLDRIRSDFATPDPRAGLCGQPYAIHSYGATKEEYSGSVWYTESGGKVYEEKSKDNFWERRMETHKKNMELAQELAQKKQIYQMWQIRQAMQNPDGEGRAPYIAGVPAAVLLSGLL